MRSETASWPSAGVSGPHCDTAMQTFTWSHPVPANVMPPQVSIGLFVLADSYIYSLCATLSKYKSDVNHLYRKYVQRDCDLVSSEQHLHVI